LREEIRGREREESDRARSAHARSRGSDTFNNAASDGSRGATRMRHTGCHLYGARFTNQKTCARIDPRSALS